MLTIILTVVVPVVVSLVVFGLSIDTEDEGRITRRRRSIR